MQKISGATTATTRVAPKESPQEQAPGPRDGWDGSASTTAATAAVKTAPGAPKVAAVSPNPADAKLLQEAEAINASATARMSQLSPTTRVLNDGQIDSVVDVLTWEAEQMTSIQAQAANCPQTLSYANSRLTDLTAALQSYTGIEVGEHQQEEKRAQYEQQVEKQVTDAEAATIKDNESRIQKVEDAATTAGPTPAADDSKDKSAGDDGGDN